MSEERREPLCPRCGSSTYVQMNERESRCSECGLGRTSMALIARTESPPTARSAMNARHDELMRTIREETQRTFASAPFSPYGLDGRWVGTRWLGGTGQSDGEVTRLVLAHGENPWDEATQQIRVEVLRPRPVGPDEDMNIAFELAALTRQQVSSYWMSTGTLDPSVRAAAFPTEHAQADLTAPWDSAEIIVDEAPIRFQLLGDSDYWLGQALHAGMILGIDARGWPAESTGLVTINDLDPYIAGSESIASRRRSRFAEER